MPVTQRLVPKLPPTLAVPAIVAPEVAHNVTTVVLVSTQPFDSVLAFLQATEEETAAIIARALCPNEPSHALGL